MRRTVERLQIGLDAKERMPDEVGNTRDQEQAGSQQREPVPSRQSVSPWRVVTPGREAGAGQHQRGAQNPAVDDRVPGREEAVRETMRMRPAVKTDSYDEPGREKGHGPLEPGMR